MGVHFRSVYHDAVMKRLRWRWITFNKRILGWRVEFCLQWRRERG